MTTRIQSPKFRNYLFTVNNPTTTLEGFVNTQEFLKKFFKDTNAVYVVGQLEKGQNNTPHIQFFANYSSQKRVAYFKRLYPTALHIEGVKINNGAHNYCMKEDTRIEGPWEFGKKPVQRNNKTDWDNVLKDAREGNIKKIPAQILIQHYGNIQKIIKDSMVPTDKKHMRGIWIWGEPGIGKSYFARKLAKDHNLDFYPKLCNKWWDGYKSQKVVIMDDIGLDHKVLGQQLKIWTDRYGCILENKGGACVDAYEWFIVTSQYTPYQIWEHDQDTLKALERRFIVMEGLEAVDKIKLRFDFTEDVSDHGLDIN